MTWGDTIRFAKKKENSHTDDKVVLRIQLLEKLAKRGIKDPMILDAFCADNVKYLKNADLEQFDLFDLDAFGSAFPQLFIIANRFKFARKKPVGFAVTDGTGIVSNLNAGSPHLLKFLGIQKHMGSPVQKQYREDIFFMGIKKCMAIMGAEIQDFEIIKKKTGARMYYCSWIASPAKIKRRSNA